MIRLRRPRPTRCFPCFAALTLVVFVGTAPGVAFADPPALMRHHLTLGLGFAHHTSDDLEDAGLETGIQGQVAYRYSLNRTLELCVDGRSFVTGDEEVFDDADGPATIKQEHETLYFGPGVRWSTGAGPVRPYLQASVFYVQETMRLEHDGQGGDTTSEGGGFGLIGGADIHLSQMFSLPVEANFLYGKADRDVSALGMQAGLTLNFLPLP